MKNKKKDGIDMNKLQMELIANVAAKTLCMPTFYVQISNMPCKL